MHPWGLWWVGCFGQLWKGEQTRSSALGVDAGALSQAQLLHCSCPPAKSADVLQSVGMPSSLAAHSSMFSPLPLSDLFISTVPFHSPASPQICSEGATGTRCRAALKPNPQNGSGKARVGAWTRSPRFMEGLGPPETLAPALIKQMGICFGLCLPVLGSPAASGVLLAFSPMAPPLMVTPVSPRSCDRTTRGHWGASEP